MALFLALKQSFWLNCCPSQFSPCMVQFDNQAKLRLFRLDCNTPSYFNETLNKCLLAIPAFPQIYQHGYMDLCEQIFNHNPDYRCRSHRSSGLSRLPNITSASNLIKLLMPHNGKQGTPQGSQTVAPKGIHCNRHQEPWVRL